MDKSISIMINGREYPLSATLRVAYKIQGQHNHKSYIHIFSEVGEMPVEQQINILWAAFEVANPEEAKTLTQVGFLNYCLDNMQLKDLTDLLKRIFSVMMGQDLDKAEEAGEDAAVTAENPILNSAT